jgi:hypothetical protein
MVRRSVQTCVSTFPVVVFGRITDQSNFRVSIQRYFRLSCAIESVDDKMARAKTRKEKL